MYTVYIYTAYICISIQYTHERRNTGRTIIWYNPPFSKNVKTNIAKQFLHSLDKSYSCMNNMKNIISGQNKRIINSVNEVNGKTYNCRNKSNCPLDNK